MANRGITQALLRLAVATREPVDEGVLAVYEEDLADFPPDVVIEACDRLRKTALWFPKVAQLLEVCGLLEREHRRDARHAALAAHEMTPDDQARGRAMRDKFLADLRELMQAKRMPS